MTGPVSPGRGGWRIWSGSRRRRRGGAAEPERELVTRTWRRIALQTTALFAVGVVAVIAVAVVVVVKITDNEAQRRLEQAATDPDALTNPPIGVIVYEQLGVEYRTSPGAPPGPVDPGSMVTVSAVPGPDRLVRWGGHDYRVRTRRQDGMTIQYALDLSGPEMERRRFYMGLAGSGAVGLALAAGFGALTARRAMAPLGVALARQRRFVADASHELRTPLTQLHTRAQLLELEVRAEADPARVRLDIDQLVRGTRQMSELLDELLAAAALRSEARTYGPVDLRALATQAAEAERPRAIQRRVEIAVDPADDHPYVVRGAEASLRRVLASLVDNALCHTPPGGQVTIELRSDDQARQVQARVRDNGEGFPAGDSQRLFERFYRGQHGDGRRYGLGLSLVREVVLAHGGTVDATGAPGVGACFTVCLPAWTRTGGDAEPARP